MNKTYQTLLQFTVLLFTVSFVRDAYASNSVSGIFSARQACDAYVSKKRRTNPGHIKLVVGEDYSLLAMNRKTNPDWYRIHMPGINSPQRWISKHCGDFEIQALEDVADSSNKDQPEICETIGLADDFILALSWQPAFCETHRRKPECKIRQRKAYQARNFVLHGLWPNKKGCGIKYEFCGEVKSQPGDFCDYPALNLYTAVRDELDQVMPSAKAGSCLQRHEWFKHGACQNQWSMDEYFEQAVDLTRQFNESGIAYFMSRHISEQVSETVFLNKIDSALGKGASKRLQLKCSNGNLVDVFVNLPKDIRMGEDLSDVISRAKPGYYSNCGNNFHIDAIGIGQ